MGKGTPKMWQCNECGSAWSEAGKVTQCLNCKGKDIFIYWQPGTQKFNVDDYKVAPEMLPSRQKKIEPPPAPKKKKRKPKAKAKPQVTIEESAPIPKKAWDNLKSMGKKKISGKLTDLF